MTVSIPAVRALACASLLALVAGCTQTGTPSPAGRAAILSGAAPAALGTPHGTGCSGEIARFRAVIDSDAQTGNLNGAVYKRMTGEIDRAMASCAAGRDADSLHQLAAAKARFGYR